MFLLGLNQQFPSGQPTVCTSTKGMTQTICGEHDIVPFVWAGFRQAYLSLPNICLKPQSHNLCN